MGFKPISPLRHRCSTLSTELSIQLGECRLFLKVPKNFRTQKAVAKSRTFWLQCWFMTCILNMHEQRLRSYKKFKAHTPLWFEEQINWKWLRGPEKFLELSRNGPWIRLWLLAIVWPALSWLDSSVGRALHQYHRGHSLRSKRFRWVWEQRKTEERPVILHSRTAQKRLLRRLQRSWVQPELYLGLMSQLLEFCITAMIDLVFIYISMHCCVTA